MPSVRMRSSASPLGLSSLVFFYLLIGIIGALLSSVYFSDRLSGGSDPAQVLWFVFLSISLVLCAFVGVAAYRVVRDMTARRAGGKLRARLLFYFFATVVLSSIPSIVIASRFMNSILDSWYSTDIDRVLADANGSALDAFRLRLAALERAADSDLAQRLERSQAEGNAEAVKAILAEEAPELAAVQTFRQDAAGEWREVFFAGNRAAALASPPADKSGFLPREAAVRDRDLARYVSAREAGTVRLFSVSLGVGFDSMTERLETARTRFQSVALLRASFARTLFLFYASFLLPSILMTLLIAISLTAIVTQPLVSLTEATRRVAEGDFSIRILTRPGDELGALVSSFNAMVSELEKSRNALLSSQKISLWQDMAQRLAHEIKNPLTPIKLSAERVLRRHRADPLKAGEIIEESMEAIIRETDALSAMLSDFRAFARLPPPLPELTSIASAVEEAISAYRLSYPNVEFRTAGIDRSLVVDVDRRQFSQVVVNLVLNAVDAMANSGRIDFFAELVKKGDTRYCRLSLKDNGRGIPADARPSVFTPYFTTKESGTGLGLSIVERIVAQHGGKVWFDTAEGVGTTFYIDLPIRKEIVGNT